MRKILLSILLAAASTSASAAWITIGTMDNGTAYFDPTTIQRAGNIARMSDLLDYKEAQSGGAKSAYLSAVSQSEYNCAEPKARLLKFSWYSGHMGAGEVVMANNAAGKWESNPSGSIAEGLWKWACGKYTNK